MTLRPKNLRADGVNRVRAQNASITGGSGRVCADQASPAAHAQVQGATRSNNNSTRADGGGGDVRTDVAAAGRTERSIDGSVDCVGFQIAMATTPR